MPDLDADTQGRLTLAEFSHGEGKMRRAAEILRDASDALYLLAEQRDGLLTPDALADQARREAQGRMAAMADSGPRLEVAGQAPMPAASNLSGCMRGVHSFGTLRGPNGEAECKNCGSVFVV